MRSDSLQSSIAKQTNIQASLSIAEVMKNAKDPKTSFSYPGKAGEEIAWVVILTSNAVEHEAVKKHLGKTTEEISLKGTIYTCGDFQTSNISWNIAIVEISPGASTAGAEAQDAIGFFKPTFIFYVGIAAGIKDVKPGDVVSVTKAYNYDRYTVSDQGILQEPESSRSSYGLWQRALAESRKPDWIDRIKGAPPTNSPCVKNEPIASGEQTIGSQKADVIQRIKSQYNDSIAIDRNGFSFLRTAHDNKIQGIVILGISNLLKNVIKQPEAQIIAARHASAFTFEVLSKIYGEDTSTTLPDESMVLTFHNTTKNIVNLSIHKYDTDTYCLRAYHNSSNIDCAVIECEINSITSGILNLLNNSDLPPSNRLQQLRRCIANLPKIQEFNKLLQWLSTQDFFKEEDTILVIYDYINLHILWELICVNQIPLGVTLQIVRQNVDFNLNVDNDKSPNCIGNILAHIREETYLWKTRYQHFSFSTFQEFLSNLAKSDEQHGLVIINGYGNEELIVKDPDEYIELSEIVKNRSSIIFINGQLNFCPIQVNLKHQEFMQLFYKYGATGVIGTLNFTGDRLTADEVISNFFNFLEDYDVLLTVPAILRAMRKQVHDQRRNNLDNSQASSVYLATFQYIYYGNPFAILQLARADT